MYFPLSHVTYVCDLAHDTTSTGHSWPATFLGIPWIRQVTCPWWFNRVHGTRSGSVRDDRIVCSQLQRSSVPVVLISIKYTFESESVNFVSMRGKNIILLILLLAVARVVCGTENSGQVRRSGDALISNMVSSYLIVHFVFYCRLWRMWECWNHQQEGHAPHLLQATAECLARELCNRPWRVYVLQSSCFRFFYDWLVIDMSLTFLAKNGVIPCSI